MITIRNACLVAFAFILFGCAAEPYKQADLGWYGGATGYREKEIGEGVYVLEYSQIGGYNYNLYRNIEYWERRASELCPSGHEGTYEIIPPIDSRLKEFQCPQRYCQQYPLVSGVIRCKDQHGDLIGNET
jgi:hypothetical protein